MIFFKDMEKPKAATKEELYLLCDFWEKVLGRKLNNNEIDCMVELAEIPLAEQVRVYGLTMRRCDKFSFNYFAKVLGLKMDPVANRKKWVELILKTE